MSLLHPASVGLSATIESMGETTSPAEAATYSRMTADVYDLIYSGKDYEAEAAKLAAIIEERGESGGRDILEAACGTGVYMQHLGGHFNVEGFDLSPEQIEGAKRRMPNAKLSIADMTDFEMGKQYDAVLCLFSSIGYLQTTERLSQAISTMAKHTKPGGMVIVEPWLPRGKFTPGHVSLDAKSNDELSVARMGISSLEGGLSVLAMHHMVGTSEGVEHFVEIHKLAMFTDEDFTDAFTAAGLEVEIDPEGLTGRRLCVAKRPLN